MTLTHWRPGAPLPRDRGGYIDYAQLCAAMSDTELRILLGRQCFTDRRVARRWCRRMRQRWGLPARLVGQRVEIPDATARGLYWPTARSTPVRLDRRPLNYAARCELSARGTLAIIQTALPGLQVQRGKVAFRAVDVRGRPRGEIRVGYDDGSIRVYQPERNSTVPLISRCSYYPYTAYTHAAGLSLLYGREITRGRAL